jgi:hypothetical protein
VGHLSSTLGIGQIAREILAWVTSTIRPLITPPKTYRIIILLGVSDFPADFEDRNSWIFRSLYTLSTGIRTRISTPATAPHAGNFCKAILLLMEARPATILLASRVTGCGSIRVFEKATPQERGNGDVSGRKGCYCFDESSKPFWYMRESDVIFQTTARSNHNQFSMDLWAGILKSYGRLLTLSILRI